MPNVDLIAGPIIEQGESESAPIDLSKGELVRLTMPGDWTTAVLSFAIPSDGEFLNDLVHVDGTEAIINVVPGAAVVIPEPWARAIVFLRIRSGTKANPVPQEERREFSSAYVKGNTQVVVEPNPARAKK